MITEPCPYCAKPITFDLAPRCDMHPTTVLVCPSCIGAHGGKVRSPRKQKAARRNGKKGGRPPKIDA